MRLHLTRFLNYIPVGFSAQAGCELILQQTIFLLSILPRAITRESSY